MNKKGFTLIEVLVVIAIIGILSGIIIANMGWAVNSANDARRKSNIDEIRKSVVYYKTQSVDGLYPIEVDECTIGGGDTPCETLASALSVILPTPPVDPVSGAYYTYYSEDGTDFTVSSTLSDSTTYSYTASTGFSTEEAPSYASTCASATNSQVQCTETTDGSYVIDTFTYLSSSGTTSWTVPDGVTSVDYLVVGGGGGGAGRGGGGGGGGGFLTGTLSVSGSVSVIVGKGGTAGSTTASTGGSGVNSSLNESIVAYGGGAGGRNITGLSGGSGGGGAENGVGGSATQGHAGGNGYINESLSAHYYVGGGGGGAGSQGSNAELSSGGAGGSGAESTITGSAVYYAGGGGGGISVWHGSGTGGAGSTGGGGAGGADNGNSGVVGTAGTDGLGGGGGGGGAGDSNVGDAIGGAGGAGVIIVRFLHP